MKDKEIWEEIEYLQDRVKTLIKRIDQVNDIYRGAVDRVEKQCIQVNDDLNACTSTIDIVRDGSWILKERINELTIRVSNLEDAGQEDLSPEQKNAQAIAVLRAHIKGFVFKDFNNQTVDPLGAVDTLEKAIEASEKW